MRRLILALPLVTFAGCQSDIASLVEQATVDFWTQTPTDQVDILWVIDNSNSMKLEQDLLADGFTSFASELEATGSNFHLGVITTTFLYDDPARGQLIGDPPWISNEPGYVELFADRVQVGLDGNGKEKGIEAAYHALSPTMTTGYNAGFLRPEANLLIVFVSDEDDCSDEGALGNSDNRDCYLKPEMLTPVEDYVARYKTLKADPSQVRIGAIVGPENTAGCIDALPGRRYMDLSNLMGGLNGNICESDWSQILFDLGLNATGIFTSFEMSHGAKPDTLMVYIDDELVPEGEIDGYTYDSELHSITFHGIWVPDRGASVRAEYVIESGT